jgi:hypothetical protein
MKKRERIAALEARVAELKAELVEARMARVAIEFKLNEFERRVFGTTTSKASIPYTAPWCRTTSKPTSPLTTKSGN